MNSLKRLTIHVHIMLIIICTNSIQYNIDNQDVTVFWLSRYYAIMVTRDVIYMVIYQTLVAKTQLLILVTSYMWSFTRLWSLVRYKGYSWRHICGHLPDCDLYYANTDTRDVIYVINYKTVVPITLLCIILTSYMWSFTRLWSLLRYYWYSWRHICHHLPDSGRYYAIMDNRDVIYVVIYQTMVAITLLRILVTSYMWSFTRLRSILRYFIYSWRHICGQLPDCGRYYAIMDNRDVIYVVIFQTVVAITLLHILVTSYIWSITRLWSV